MPISITVPDPEGRPLRENHRPDLEPCPSTAAAFGGAATSVAARDGLADHVSTPRPELVLNGVRTIPDPPRGRDAPRAIAERPAARFHVFFIGSPYGAAIPIGAPPTTLR